MEVRSKQSGSDYTEKEPPTQGEDKNALEALRDIQCLQSTINQKREERGPTSKTTMPGEHGRQGPEQQEGAEGSNSEVEEEEDDGGEEEEQRRGEEVNEPVHPMDAANLPKYQKDPRERKKGKNEEKKKERKEEIMKERKIEISKGKKKERRKKKERKNNTYEEQ
ncbi:unnamed protein product [Arctogadus glacialis]